MIVSWFCKARPCFCLLVAGLAAFLLIAPREAAAIPAFARQTGQPCATCHVGAFGPQLKQFGRDFKLNGYVLSNGDDQLPHLAFGVQGSLTHSQTPQSGGMPTGFGPTGPNNNFAVDQVELFFGGRIAPEIGAFVQTTYNEVTNNVHWDDTDIRYAHGGALVGTDYVAGITVNNHPSLSDIWNSTPAWGFPYVAGQLAPGPANLTHIDNMLAQRVVGAGAYGMWNNWFYAELDGYQPIALPTLNALGIVPIAGATTYEGVLPYWRFAAQHDFGPHYVQFGTFGFEGNANPGGDTTTGRTDQFTDLGFDANYQWTGASPAHMISAHAAYIDEHLNLGASSLLVGANPKDRLSTLRTDVSYSFKDTIIPSVQFFNSWGSNDPNFFGTPGGTPNTSGFISEIAFVPFGKADSLTFFYNMRFDIQYVAFTKFGGVSSHASDNNSWYFNLWLIGAAW
jgi:hypothetical protein